jgi:hypothetical protein
MHDAILIIGNYPKLIEAVRILDSTRLIELESYEWLGNYRVLLVYGPSEVIKTL